MRRKLALPPVIDYNTVNVADSDDVRTAKIEMWIAKTLGTRLCLLYPGIEWFVNVDAPNQVVIISSPDVSITKGYRMFMLNRTIQQMCEQLKNVGGEILERGNIPRTGNTPERIENLKRDINHNVVGLDNTNERPI